MAPREDLVASAVSFLQDPSVASSPVEKRIEFLKSKNLTQEEIDVSLARAAGELSPPANAQQTPYYPPQNYRGPPSSRYPYPYNPYGEWQQPPPEPPRRDWRDWFIMATVVGGAGYGLYALTQRYIKPLIAPPTPPQLEQDKAAIDEQFNKAFALLDTLSADTAALKEAEEARTQRLDKAISDVESIVTELRAASIKREDESRRMETEIKNMKDGIPRSIDNVRDASERQLRELSTELASLKLLMGNRIIGASNFGSAPQGIPRTQPGTLPSTTTSSTTPATETAPSTSTTASTSSTTRPPVASPGASYNSSASVPASSSATPKPSSSSPWGSSGSKAAIPAWQMAAQNKAKEFQAAPTGGLPPTENPTSPPVDGAEAVALLGLS